MPLAIENGTVLVPEVDGPAPEKHILDIKHIPQEGKLWCWAACVQMVLDFYERTKPEGDIKTISQCEIVRTMLGDQQHPCAPDPQEREESCDFDQMKSVWQACGIQKELRDPEAVLSIAGIRKRINDQTQQPIEVGLAWDDGGGHAVLIKGWSATNPETLVIDDPLRESAFHALEFDDVEPDGSGRATHGELKRALGHGIWTRTWFNLVPSSDPPASPQG
jgi:hypothetical protein